MIKIGVSACFMYPDPSRLVFGHKSLTYMENDMARYLSRPGIMLVLIPDLPIDEQLQYLNEIDALVLQGGVDVSPKSYGDELIENGRWPGDKYRDDYELRLIDFAVKNKRPILGICRGFQILNTYFGGKLYQDLEIETKTSVLHRSAEKYDRIHHSVDISEGSWLKECYQTTKLEVNTVHHQGVKTLGQDLIVEAVCPNDNLIEAFRHKDDQNQFIWGVQWHPEFNHTLSGTVASAKPIYDKFIQVVKERKNYENC